MPEEAMIRIRLSAQDAHYGGGLVSGAKILSLFGDAATELVIRHDGDEGLLRAYEEVEFLAPVYSGDYLEVTGRIAKVGNTSRRIELTAKKVIAPSNVPGHPSAADPLEEPIVVARAVAIAVVLKERQRKTNRP